MGAGVRTEGLRKVYTSPPPLAAGGSFAPALGKRGAKPKKAFQVVALDGVSLEIRAGEIFGLLGPNGAGKSTTLGILTTRVRPTEGHAWIGDYNVWQQQVHAKRLIGVVQQRPNLDFALTAREILSFHAAYYGVAPADRGRRSAELLERFQLTDRAHEMVRGFSGGMMQRLAIARAMMHDPQVLFLDEPSTGLDPQTRLLLWEIIREYNRSGRTVMLSTHNMEEADALCHRIAIIDHGHVIALGTPYELKHSIPGGYLLRLKFSHHSPEVVERLRQLPGVTEVQIHGAGAEGGQGVQGAQGAQGDGVDLYADRGGSLIREIVAVLAESATDLHDVHISEPSLENLFLHHTGRSLRQ